MLIATNYNNIYCKYVLYVPLILLIPNLQNSFPFSLYINGWYVAAIPLRHPSTENLSSKCSPIPPSFTLPRGITTHAGHVLLKFSDSIRGCIRIRVNASINDGQCIRFQ